MNVMADEEGLYYIRATFSLGRWPIKNVEICMDREVKSLDPSLRDGRYKYM